MNKRTQEIIELFYNALWHDSPLKQHLFVQSKFDQADAWRTLMLIGRGFYQSVDTDTCIMTFHNGATIQIAALEEKACA